MLYVDAFNIKYSYAQKGIQCTDMVMYFDVKSKRWAKNISQIIFFLVNISQDDFSVF